LGGPTYAQRMLAFLVILAIVVVGVVVWRRRVPLLAKLLGQSESRVDRALNQRKR
jgi:O-antigen ligase